MRICSLSMQGMFLVNVSSCAGYMWNTMAPERPSYAMTKNASTLLIQQIAKDTIPDDMQIISFHPGAIATEEVTRRMGSDASMNVPFDDGTSSYNYLTLLSGKIIRNPFMG